jgi:UDP-N-acetylmuramate dehydrogenase
MHFQEDVPLRSYNSFGIDAKARYFATFSDTDMLAAQLKAKGDLPLLVLGGGSNVLLTRDFDGLVLRNEIEGMETVREEGDSVFVKAGAGVNWHRFVLHCIRNDYAGVENLSLIPGSVGASPMQNIGAYGVEIKDVFHELEAMEIATGKLVTFSHSDCAFGYRESVFKNKFKGQFIITSVTYRLSKNRSSISNTELSGRSLTRWV